MKIKRPTINAVIFLLGLILVYWNIKLGLSLEKLRKHPDKIEILLKPDDSITQQVKAIEDSLKVSIIVPKYENDELNQSISTLSAIAEMLGQVLAALALFISILVAFGFFEVNSWRSIRKGIEEGGEKIEGLSEEVQDKIQKIEKSKEVFEKNIKDLEFLSQDLNQRINYLQSKSQEAQEQVNDFIIQLEQKHEDIISSGIHFKEFKNNILNLFYNYRKDISEDLEKDLQRVKEANYGSYQYPEELKFKLKEYLQVYRYFGSLLNTISDEEITLKSIDYFALGIASLLDRQFEESKKFFERAVETNPNDHIACFKLGTVCYQLHDFTSAISKLEDAINLEPNFAAAYYNLGLSFNRLGEREKAIIAFKEVIRIDNSYIDAYINLSAIYVLINELDEADSTLDIILDNNISNHYKLYYNKACIYSLKKNKPDALSFLEKAINFDPSGNSREDAKQEKAFQWLVDSEEFISIIK